MTFLTLLKYYTYDKGFYHLSNFKIVIYFIKLKIKFRNEHYNNSPLERG